MRSTAKRLLDPVRYDRRISRLARYIAQPIVAAGRQAEQKVWINGGTATYDGLDITFPPDVGVYLLSRIYWCGLEGYEPAVWRTIKALLPPEGLFVDVGANVGFYSVLAKTAAPGCEVWAVEPVPTLQSAIRKLAAANNVEVMLIPAALSAMEGQIDLFISRQAADIASNASIQTKSWQATEAAADRLRVPTRSLDSVCKDTGAYTNLVKIDVEESEQSVLQGMARIMSSSRPPIVCEVLPVEYNDHSETFALITAAGYSVYAITETGLFLMDGFPPRRSFWNFLLSPRPRGQFIAFDELRP